MCIRDRFHVAGGVRTVFLVNLWSICGQFVVSYRSAKNCSEVGEPEKMRTMMMKTTTTRMIADVYEAVFGRERRSVTLCLLISRMGVSIRPSCRPPITFTFGETA